MRSRLFWRSGICGLALLGCVATGLAAAVGTGVVVEDVGVGSALERDGVQVGDRVLAWERLPAPPANPEGAWGEIGSYFDWWWLIHEQAPRGTVRLTVERDGEALVVEVTSGLWKIAKVRAWLPEDLLARYRQGREYLEAKEVGQGVALWEGLVEGASPWEVRCWLWLRTGEVWSEARAWDKAQEAFSAALEVADDALARGVIQFSRGDAYRRASQFEAAREALAAARETWNTNFGEHLPLALVLHVLGVVAYDRGDLDRAQDYYQHSLTIRQQLAPESLVLAASLNNLGNLAFRGGDLDRAQGYYQHSLEIFQQLAPESFVLAASLSNLGNLVVQRGDLDRAQDYFQRSLEVREQLAPESLVLAASLSNLGNVVLRRGDLDRAQDYFQRSLEIREQLAPNSLVLAASLNNLGNVVVQRGDLDRAQDYFQRSLELREQLAPNSLVLAASLNNLGNVVLRRDDLDRAQGYYQRSLEIQEQLAPNSLVLVGSLRNLGNLVVQRGDLDQAQGYYQRSLEIRKRLAPGSAGEAATLYDLATLRRQQNKPHRALLLLDQALTSLETQLGRLGGSHERQATFRAGSVNYYRDFLEVSLELHQAEAAFHALERFRARTFLQQLTERDAVFSADLPEDLDRRRRTLAVRLDRTQGRLAHLNPRDHAEEIDATHEKLGQLRQEAAQLEQDIRRASPRLAALQYPQPLDFEAARATLDAGTLLLAFSLGDETTNVFAISPGAALHVETLPIGEDELRRKVEGFRTALEATLPGSPRMASLEARARDLYDTLLSPLAERIDAAQRLLILPEGPLYYLPWAALRRSTEEGQRYLVEQLPIHIAVSATVYAELQQDRRPAPPQDIQVAGFGDPVYPGSQAAARGHDDIIVRSINERSIFDWQPLPHTRREIEGLAMLYPESNLTYLGPQATEEQAKDLGRGVRIVHFATHGHVDDRFPMNSFLALSIPEQPKEGQDNGLLQVWEIYESLRLDADLVVLSACESGLGEELRGEGLMGLTRAFHYAGARSVLSTLWSVDDEATAELMLRFHRHLAGGLSKDEALRAAQLELIRGPIDSEGETLDASAPRSWAAFQLYGDWQ